MGLLFSSRQVGHQSSCKCVLMYLNSVDKFGKMEAPLLGNHPDTVSRKTHYAAGPPKPVDLPKRLNSLGAERRPKGRHVSINTSPFYCIPSMYLSFGCTGSRRNALFISILASNVRWPCWMIPLMASSMVMYFREHKGLEIPSLTLWPLGWIRSTISLHFPFWLLGITPNRLMCTCGTACGGMGPPHDQ